MHAQYAISVGCPFAPNGPDGAHRIGKDVSIEARISGTLCNGTCKALDAGYPLAARVATAGLG